MKHAILIAASLLAASTAFAQWEFHIAAGSGYATLIPAREFKRHSPYLHYGPTKPGMFLSPSLGLRASDKETFSLGYQLASSFVGVRIAPPGIGKGRDYMQDGITTHNFYVGFEHAEPMARGRLKAGVMARAGVVYGQMVSMGGGSRTEVEADGLFYSGSIRITGFDVMPDFWAPSGTLGLSLTPVFEARRVQDRLRFILFGTLIARNPYARPSVAEYALASPTVAETGRAYLSGMPVQMQAGLDYKLFPRSQAHRSTGKTHSQAD